MTDINAWLGWAWPHLLAFLVSLGGAVVAFVILLPSKIGEGLLNHAFDKKLEAVKTANGIAIEKLKEELAHTGDRGKRSNEREYAALSAVWEHFVEAHMATMACILSFVQSPDLDRMSDDAVSNWTPPRTRIF